MDAETRSQFEQMSAEVARHDPADVQPPVPGARRCGPELDNRPVELDVLCLEVYRQTKDLRPDLNYRLGQEEQVTVMGDRDLLKQMVLNLVDNSLKYTPAGGEVTLSLSAGDSGARLEVRDTGPGIEPDQIPLHLSALLPGQDRRPARQGRSRHRAGHQPVDRQGSRWRYPGGERTGKGKCVQGDLAAGLSGFRRQRAVGRARRPARVRSQTSGAGSDGR